ncbi:MAG: S9 family peptidase [Bacteroidales bacterium]|nr:S9 family peptidase [Bacteroidales bacterium]
MYNSKIISSIAMTVAMMATTSCSSDKEEANIIDRPTDVKIENRQYSIDVLEALGRVSGPAVSPDGKKVLYNVSYESVEQNKSNNDLYVKNIDGTDSVRLTKTAKSEGGAAWIENGEKIAFLYADEAGVPQLWVMNADGSGRKCVSSLENGVEGFKFSPDSKKVVLVSSVKYSREAKDVYSDLPEATGRIIDDLMYKHWDQWTKDIPHPFVADFTGDKVENVEDIMASEPYECPMRPFGGVEAFAWSPDSKSLVYSSRKKTGLEYAVSTNSDLYLYSLEDKSTRNLTEGMMGYDTNPAFSPDGTKLAWLSMEHDGYESDKNRIFIMDMATGEKTDLTSDWDYTASEIAWNTDGKTIYFIAAYQGVTPIFSVDVATKEVKTVADGVCDYVSLCPADANTLVSMYHSFTAPNEVCVIKDGKVSKITAVNDALLASVDMPDVVKRQIPTTDGKMMTTWVLYPPKFDPSKKYPAILYCQGGPQQAVSQFWSYRWNLALMASQGYIVIAPNRRGLPGFGTEWNAQISKDYPGQNMKDYLSAVDDMKKEAYVDAEHIGAVGASYGGYSVYWLAGNHEGRFACLIAHAGIFNIETQYLETEEMWFANWDMGGAYWDKDNKAAQNTFANGSPHRFVDKWTAPILITHGEYDFRILASQGEMAFNAARLRGVPAEMLIFPDENHWILKPQNAILWQRIFFRWLDKWLKGVDYQNPPLYQASEQE